MKVGDLMTTGVVTVEEDATLAEAATKMREANVGVVLITRDGKLSGILVDRAIVIRGVANGRDVNTTQVREIMTPDPKTATPDMDVSKAAKIMAEGKFRRLPVVEGGEIRGIISISDIAHYAKFLTSWIFEEISKARKKELFMK
ncbi:CBS domain-containing protein [Candidatus Pyrohabitans sp.]